MDTIEKYRKIVQKIILEYAQFKPSHGDIDTEAIFDPECNHYELMHVGWDGPRRVHGSIRFAHQRLRLMVHFVHQRLRLMVLHVDIINGKVWIQHDSTEAGIVDELEENNILFAIKLNVIRQAE